MLEIDQFEKTLYKREDLINMALGFTSHFKHSEQPFGSLILSNNETETSGSVAHSGESAGSIAYSGQCDSYEFSVSVNIDYSQYANYVCSSGSTETAGSVAYSGGGSGFSSAGASCGGGCSVSSGGGGGCSASFTC